jgi:hypothetical protein
VESFSAPTAITNSQPLNHREQVLAEAAAHRKTKKEQENTEGKDIHSASTSHLHHRLRRLQREHWQEETELVITGRAQETAASSSSPVSNQVSVLHSFNFCKFNYTVTVHAFVTVQVNYNSLEQ